MYLSLLVSKLRIKTACFQNKKRSTQTAQSNIQLLVEVPGRSTFLHGPSSAILSGGSGII